MHLPLFIEVLQSKANADLQICRRIMAQLFRQRISPLPFATSINEVVDVLHSLRNKGLAPKVFVINTLWAEEILRDLDAVVGDTPILLLNRRILDSKDKLDIPLQDIEHRNIAVCRYGAKTVNETSELVANALYQYAHDGEFWHLQSLGGMSSVRLSAVSR
jgi:hypothetical protein